ncbi:hypothetical protein [Sandaracinus amylolyticus]|uniref:Uncharacterized protein n=1 Tax=Sandaracinus amylolyticus TaxID=927083 RepID=A0A0F6SGL5_9BACT|nr:hypothetical protein [Sandaracinus amylolyticus]AKF08904.1 hypothetical protein DB32_006053 [Sandaracinus amylolyticus]
MSRARRERRAERAGTPALPAVGTRYRDGHGATWRVAATHADGTPRVTVEAGGLRRTMTLERLAETMERVA